MKYLLNLLILVSLNSMSAEIVTSNCDWKPPTPKILQNLQSIKKIEDQESKNLAIKSADNDYSKVEQKGRLYFHSLPNETCKTDIFIVKGDTIEIIDEYPENSPEFARVIYFSKNMKKDIVGWVKKDALRRMTYSETRKD